MKTPIVDFITRYADSKCIRLHMPGHKGIGELEKTDITEIFGADSLFHADGIIAASERFAGEIFGAYSFYSTEGSSLSIRAMLHLASLYARENGSIPLVLAGRNAHKSFISAAALIGFSVEWLYSKEESYLSCKITPSELDDKISSMIKKPTAVYITSPDYLGNVSDIYGLSKVCKKHGILLLVDNAHGAYLKFLNPSHHPIDLGADMCADSAHKTLHALTGAAYLHISKNAPKMFRDQAKSALSLFASTSPSYLILSSLDKLNATLWDGYSEILSRKIQKINILKQKLSEIGYSILDGEPLKITILTKPYGYTGEELAEILYKKNIVSEFSDRDYLVLMPSSDTNDAELEALLSVLNKVQKKEPICSPAPTLTPPTRVLSPREAVFSPSEEIDVDNALGRVLADVTVSCPPAVPILVSGEIISKEAISAFKYYGTQKIKVIK